MADSLLNLTVAVLEDPSTVAERFLATSEDAASSNGQQRMLRELGGLLARDAKIVARVDSVTRGAAAGTVVVDQSNCTAGDILYVQLPGRPRLALTAVATDAEVTAAPNTGLWSIETASDDTTGANLAAAINDLLGTRQFVSAANSTGTVTITALEAGSWGDSISLTKAVTTGAALTITAFAGGDDALDQPTMDIVFGTPNIAADDTISIGAREYTWKASASADGEITLSTTETTAATNFAAAVNADTNLTGIVTAAANSATVTLTFVCDPRLAQHILVTYSETNAGSVVPAGTVLITGAEAPLLGSTVTGSSTSRTYGGRGAA